MDNTDLCNTQILKTTLAILKTQDDSNSIHSWIRMAITVNLLSKIKDSP